MTNNELLAKMLDGTLTASERTILNAEAAAHPEFANELEQMKRIESILTKSGNRYDIPTPAFLQSVEDEIAQKVRDSRSVKPIPILPPNIFDIKFNWNLLIMACSGLVTVASLGYYAYNKLYPPNPIVVTEQQTVSQPENTVNSTDRSVQSSPVKAKSISAAPKQTYSNHTIQNSGTDLQKTIAENNSSQKSESLLTDKDTVSGIVKQNTNLNTDTPDIQKLLLELNEKRTAGDRISEMRIKKQIGMLYTSSRNNSEAHKYLNEALEIAKNMKIRDAEGSITGEIGLVEMKMGNTEIAVAKIHQAIDILNASGNSSAKWTKELSKLQSK